MDYRIEILGRRKLVGIRLEMSFACDSTFKLWRRFMSLRNGIPKRVSDELFSMQIYPESFFDDFNPDTVFEKWAAVEVSDYDEIPAGLETFELVSGLYAVFHYKGRASEASEAFKYILGSWMSDSGYKLDTRPHFEILGAGYKNDDPASEEEIWIPIKPLT